MEWSTWVIIFPILLFSIAVFILLIGPLPRCRGTLLETAYWWLTDDFPVGVKRTALRICGRRVTQCIGRSVGCFVGTAHPFFQALFMVLFGGGLCCASDPGRITDANANLAQRMFPYDLVLFNPYPCRTCKFIKPARSKHCSLCRTCIAGMDHHCVWINNCVGHNNIHLFVSFLASMASMLGYGSWLIFNIFRGFRESAQLDDAWYYDYETRQRVKVTWFQSYQMILAEQPFLGALGILMGLIAPALVIFLGYAFYLIACGATANESDKWSDLNAWIEDGGVRWGPVSHANRVFIESSNPNQRIPDRQVVIDEEVSSSPASDAAAAADTPSTMAEVDSPSQLEGMGPAAAEYGQITSLEEVDNLYDHGWSTNLKYTLFWGPALPACPDNTLDKTKRD
ncbi:palmitoyltransferase swf1 [Dimargaris cristalligena]|nr:palmitoyltransferase swf1 [Dimargaris cristalligena]